MIEMEVLINMMLCFCNAATNVLVSSTGLRSVNFSDWAIYLSCFIYDFTKDYLARFLDVTM
jgi:hypothetical protein